MGGFSRELCETEFKRLLRKACVAVGSVTSNCIAAPGRGPFHEHLFFKKVGEGFALARAVLETLCIVEDYCRNTGIWPEV